MSGSETFSTEPTNSAYLYSEQRIHLLWWIDSDEQQWDSPAPKMLGVYIAPKILELASIQ